MEGESERYGLVTFNLVALHIAILHFTYDGDIQDNNNKNNQGRQVNKLSPQRQHTQWDPKNHKQGDRKMTFNIMSL